MANKRNIRKFIIMFILIVIAVVDFYPIFMVITNSFKSIQEFYLKPLSLPSKIDLTNLKYAISRLDYFNGFKNNIIVASLTLVIMIIAGSLAAYPIARRPSKVKSVIFVYFLSGLILPAYTMMVPLVIMMKNLGLLNSYLSLVLAYGGAAMPLSVLIYRGFLRTIPIELEEAAMIDGCNMFTAFIKIYLPVLKTTTATIIVIQSIGIWNDFLLPNLFMTDAKMKTLMPALYSFYGRMLGVGTRWDWIFPAMLAIIAPLILVFIIANKSIIKGMTAGALKG